MEELHGLRNVTKISGGGGGGTQSVLVGDDAGWVRLSLSECSYPARLTTEEARFIAAALIAAAERMEASKQ